MANKDELKKGQEPEKEELRGNETPAAKPETEGKQEDKNMKERKPWSTKKKVGVGGSIILTLIGLGCWAKKKFFSGEDDDEEPDD